MIVAAQKYMRRMNVIPPDRYLATDSLGTARTQERRRPCRLAPETVRRDKGVNK